MNSGLFNLDFLNEDVSIPVPGGDKETPNSKPNDEHSITIPGGDKETPGKNSIELEEDEYNNALSSLQKSFKEGFEIVGLLRSATITNTTIDDLQEEFTENAIYESYITGPYFEKVTDESKNEVREVIDKIYKKYADMSSLKYEFEAFKPKGIFTTLKKWGLRLLRRNSLFKTTLWQMAGIISVKKEEDAEKALNYYRNFFKNELGKFTFNLLRITSKVEVAGNTVLQGEVKNRYILIVDDSKKELKTITLEDK